jgi:hypothetical protein
MTILKILHNQRFEHKADLKGYQLYSRRTYKNLDQMNEHESQMCNELAHETQGFVFDRRSSYPNVAYLTLFPSYLTNVHCILRAGICQYLQSLLSRCFFYLNRLLRSIGYKRAELLRACLHAIFHMRLISKLLKQSLRTSYILLSHFCVETQGILMMPVSGATHGAN